MTLRHHSAQLGNRFDKDHAGHQGLAGKMPVEKGFVATHLVGGSAGLARNQAGESIHEPEGQPVRERSERGSNIHVVPYPPMIPLPRAGSGAEVETSQQLRCFHLPGGKLPCPFGKDACTCSGTPF